MDMFVPLKSTNKSLVFSDKVTIEVLSPFSSTPPWIAKH